MAAPGNLTLGTNIGTVGYNFSTPILGVSAGGIVRVIQGNARTGAASLVIDNMPYGVMNVTVREVNSDGFRDTDFVVYGVTALDERSVALAALAKGQSDAQQRAAIAAGASTFAGLQGQGLGVVPNAPPSVNPTPTPTPTPTPSLNALTVSNGSGTVGSVLSSTISGATSGSTLSLTGSGAAGLSITGTAISGTPTTAGAVNIVETMAGATNSPRTTSSVITVAAAGVPTDTYTPTNTTPGFPSVPSISPLGA